MAQRRSRRRSETQPQFDPVELPGSEDQASDYDLAELPGESSAGPEAGRNPLGFDPIHNDRLRAAQAELESLLGLSVESSSIGPLALESTALVGGPFGGDNFRGTCIAEKEPGSNEPAIVVFVDKKSETDGDAGPHRIPKEIRGVLTDVVEVGEIQLQAGPAPGSGIDVDRRNQFGGVYGTLGCFCTRDLSQDKRLYLLSNAHVLTPTSFFKSTETLVSGVGANNSVPIARLRYWTAFNTSLANNFADVAMAHADPGRIDASGSFRLDGSPMGSSEYRTGLAVTKLGARTGRTQGTLRGWSANFPLNYPGVGRVRYQNQLWIEGTSEDFSARGDSGSLVVSQQDHRPVGLHFAGSGRNSFANRIEDVMRIFGIRKFMTTL